MNDLSKLGIAILTIMSIVTALGAQVNHFGWVHADYGYGKDRYGDANGGDRLGVTQLALGIKSVRDNLTLIGLIGANALSGPGSTGAIGLQDAFIVWDKIGGSQFGISVGVQPLLFGLKPNGYPGDRSLIPSLEYGGAGGMAIAQQAGPSIVMNYAVAEGSTLFLGLFDHSSTNLAGTEGSSLFTNVFAQAKFTKLGVEGLYGVVGFESRYVGGAVDGSKPVFDAGLGIKVNQIDVSAEVISLDKGMSGTAGNELYVIAEITYDASPESKIYFDWGKAKEMDVQTIRAGTAYNFTRNLTGHLEYSMDRMPSPFSNISSFDARLSLNY